MTEFTPVTIGEYSVFLPLLDALERLVLLLDLDLVLGAGDFDFALTLERDLCSFFVLLFDLGRPLGLFFADCPPDLLLDLPADLPAPGFRPAADFTLVNELLLFLSILKI